MIIVEDYPTLPEGEDLTLGPYSQVHHAAWAHKAIAAYADATGLDIEWRYEDDYDTAIADLLGDLLHLCDVRDLDFDALLARGSRHYGEEKRMYAEANSEAGGSAS